MEVGSRRIVHFNITVNPTLEWVKQQLREATVDLVPRFLIHDNEYIKAKADKSWRFWGLYVHICKMETLQEAYNLAKKNQGSPRSRRGNL